MADVTVRLRHLHQAPRKVRLVIDVVRGVPAQRALDQLAVMPQESAQIVRKLLVSGIAAAKQKGLNDQELRVAAVYCDQGPALKRRQINSRGRASMIKKFLSHITLTLSDVPAKKGRS